MSGRKVKMNSPRKSIPSLVIVATLLFFSGCFKSRSEWEEVHPVNGEITFKGRPLANAELTFFPTDPKVPDSVRPRARSTEDGQFVVWTYQQGDGAPVGNYKVTAVHNEVGISKDTVVAKPNDLPAKLARRDTTDLEVKIVAGKNHLPRIELR